MNSRNSLRFYFIFIIFLREVLYEVKFSLKYFIIIHNNIIWIDVLFV